MAIPASQRQAIVDLLVEAIARYYGDSVPTLKKYLSERRAVFIAQLREKVSAASLEEAISQAKANLGAKKSAYTRLQNGKQISIERAAAERDEQIERAKAAYQKALVKIGADYDYQIEMARQAVDNAESEVVGIARAAYFSALGEQDDGRHVWLNVNNALEAVSNAISERVDDYVENHLDDDDLGEKVKQRMREETIASNSAWVVDKMALLREQILDFIDRGILPEITLISWNIKDGKDITASR